MGYWMQISHKQTIIRKAQAFPAMSEADLPAWVKVRYKWRSAHIRNTNSDVLKNAAVILIQSRSCISQP
ncbi:hypothetical protein V7S43_012718 [Phytophthora oleae]|uniref:Uncharacterized protein n=1 Tax=Phytophthora oleae TaxID=2107226 RepID=A0ABD3F7D3_9STRA